MSDFKTATSELSFIHRIEHVACEAGLLGHTMLAEIVLDAVRPVRDTTFERPKNDGG